MTDIEKLEALTNDNMINLMYHQWNRYKVVNSNHINAFALWQKWIRR